MGTVKCCSARVSLAQFPIHAPVQDIKGESGVKTFPTTHDFPLLGEVYFMYLSSEENAVYRWDDVNLKYYCVGRDYMEIEVINGGDLEDGN